MAVSVLTAGIVPTNGFVCTLKVSRLVSVARAGMLLEIRLFCSCKDTRLVRAATSTMEPDIEFENMSKNMSRVPKLSGWMVAVSEFE